MQIVNNIICITCMIVQNQSAHDWGQLDHMVCSFKVVVMCTAIFAAVC